VIRTTGSDDASGEDDLTLLLTDLAVKEDVSGSITIEVADIALPTFFNNTATTAGAVSMSDALVVDVDPESYNATASVKEDFKKFLGSDNDKVTIGHLNFGVAMTDPSTDAQGQPIPAAPATKHAESGEDLDAVADIVEATRSTITFGGERTFASTIKWGDLDALDRDKEGAATGWATISIQVTGTNARGPTLQGFLVVTVDGKTVIPKSTYTANLQLQPGVTGSLFAPASRTVEVGEIDHDGTSVSMPYLTTDSRYNQRIIIVHQGVEAATYSFAFNSEANLMAIPGMKAEGMLAPNSTTVVRTSDVVTIEGGPPHRVSAVLTIAAEDKHISVASNQTNKETGGTDTVMYNW
jgi:hypothetical protein